MVIRSGGIYAARSIFAEQNMPWEEKTTSLLREYKCVPCGFAAREDHRSERQIRLGGSVGGSIDPHAFSVED